MVTQGRVSGLLRVARAAMIATTLAVSALLQARGEMAAHALHTTMTDITAGPTAGALHVVIRVFADDFGKASASSGPDPMAYVRHQFVLQSGAQALVLRPCGTTRNGALLFICMDATAPRTGAPLQLRNALLCELYDDQVNIVRSVLGASPTTVLFTRGDRARPLR